MSSSSQQSLSILRIGLFLFMMVWAVEKFVRPEAYQSIFGTFYGFDAGVALVYIIGAIQVGVLLLFVAGKFKFISYGLVMLMNVITLIVSMGRILAPYEGSTNHLFVASIVVAANSIALFLARADDNFLTLKSADPAMGESQIETESSSA